jgi:hypothetical protein
MIEYPYGDDAWVKCSCCGALIENDPDHNVYLHEPDGSPYPSDDGFGMCIPCGGDPKADRSDTSEANLRKRLGWGMQCFYDTRIETLEKSLNEKNAAKFKAMPYGEKVAFIMAAIEDGIMF